MKHLLVLFASVFCLLSGNTLFAVPHIIINEDTVKYSVCDKFELLVDVNEKWTLEDVKSEHIRKQFYSQLSQNVNLGFGARVVWGRFILKNTTQNDIDLLFEFEYPNLDYIEFFLPQNNNSSYSVKKSGRMIPFYERDVAHRMNIFSIKMRKNEEIEVFFRVSSEGVLKLTSNIWFAQSYLQDSQLTEHFIGLYFGSMFVMVIYNLFLFFSLKDKTYLFYVFFITSFILMQLSLTGVGMQYFWPNSPEFSRTSLPLFTSLCIIFVVYFTIYFLNIHKEYPRIYRVFIGYTFVSYLVIINTLLSSFRIAIQVSNITAVIGALFCIFTGIYLVVKKVHTAKYYVIAWSVLMISSVIYITTAFNVIPGNIFTEYILNIASIMLVLLLSLGLADKINQMKEEIIIAHEQTNIAQTKSIKLKDEFLSMLENKVTERTFQLQQKTNDINCMLQNMQQGIFTLNSDLAIHPEYSVYLEKILEEQDISLQNGIRLLFDNSNLTNDQVNQIETVVGMMIEEDITCFEINRHILVGEYMKVFHDERIKSLELDWNPICDCDNIIEKVMISIRDVTELRKLQKEASNQRRELEIIGQILAVSEHYFSSFIESSEAFIEENQKYLESSSVYDKDVIAVLFRNMHTIKGNARTYGFTHVSNAAHSVEQTYDDLRKSEDPISYDSQVLLDELSLVRDMVRSYSGVFNANLQGYSGVNDDFVSIEKQLLDTLSTITHDSQENNISSEELSTSLNYFFQAIDSQTLGKVLSEIISSVSSMAKDLSKPVPKVELVDNGIRFDNSIVPVLKDVFMHIFRNSMDHGIESEEVRVSKGKKSQGSINVVLNREPDVLLLIVSDDGKGLDLLTLLKKAKQSDFFNSNDEITYEDAANMIFKSGVSTAKEVTNISGRGVGMDAVKSFLNKLDGDIALYLLPGDNEGRQFEFHVSLPLKYGVFKNV